MRFSREYQNIFAFEEYGFPMIADAGTTPNEFLKVIRERRGGKDLTIIICHVCMLFD